jgi:hypothetical protein
MRLKLLLILTCLITSTVFLTGCDSTLEVKGKVFESVPNLENGTVNIINISRTKTRNIQINEFPPELT